MTIKPIRNDNDLRAAFKQLELVENHLGDTFRAVYTVRFAKAVYVLHCFQKKSPSGVRTSKSDIDLIHDRLKLAQQHYKEHYEK